jgi:hypothetical protein
VGAPPNAGKTLDLGPRGKVGAPVKDTASMGADIVENATVELCRGADRKSSVAMEETNARHRFLVEPVIALDLKSHERSPTVCDASCSDVGFAESKALKVLSW